MVLKPQESLECRIPLDGSSEVITQIPRSYPEKISKTTFCDARRNLLKICLAFCMAFVLALLVAVVVLDSTTLCKNCKKAWKIAFYDEDDSIPGLLCIKCNSFHPSSDLTPYKELGTVRVFHARAAGSYCCVETADELERLRQLVKPQAEKMVSSYKKYHSVESRTHYDMQKPVAHLFLNVSKRAKQGDCMPWSIIGGYGTAFVGGGVTYSLGDGKLKVPKSGHYYIYSHVTFRLRKPDPTKLPASLYRHYILRCNPHLPNTGEQEIVSDAQTKLPLKKNQSYLLQSSYLGAILELRKDDQVFVGVSDIASVYWVAEENFFGLYRI